MGTNPGYAVYFIGGPFDLTKRMYPGDMPKSPYIPMVERELLPDIDWTTSLRNVVGSARNVLYRIDDGPHIVTGTVTYIAYFQRNDL